MDSFRWPFWISGNLAGTTWNLWKPFAWNACHKKKGKHIWRLRQWTSFHVGFEDERQDVIWQRCSIHFLIGTVLELWFACSPKKTSLSNKRSGNPNQRGSKIFMLETSRNQQPDGIVFTLHNVLDIWHSPSLPIAKPMTLSISPPLLHPRHALAIFLEHRHLRGMVLPAGTQTSDGSRDWCLEDKRTASICPSESCPRF